jgi:hypothetical protein
LISEQRKSNELKERSIELDEYRTLFGEDAPPGMRAAVAQHMRAKWLQNITRRQDSSPTLLPVLSQSATPEFDNSAATLSLIIAGGQNVDLCFLTTRTTNILPITRRE